MLHHAKKPFRLLKAIFFLLKESAEEWNKDDAASLGAAIAYYAAFSIAPLLLMVIAVAGLLVGDASAEQELFSQLRGLIGEHGAATLREIVRSASDSGQGLTAALISGVTLFIGATTVLAQLQKSLDRIWDAPPRTGLGVWNLVKVRLQAFGLVLVVGFLLAISMVATAAIAFVSSLLGGWIGQSALLLQWINMLFSFAVITLLFAMTYRFLPNLTIAWRDVLVGAAVTSVLFSLGKTAIGLYIGRSAISSSFGAAGTFIVILVWIYYSSMIYLFGAEFCQVYARNYGSLRERNGSLREREGSLRKRDDSLRERDQST